jgi:hypothetical protein
MVRNDHALTLLDVAYSLKQKRMLIVSWIGDIYLNGEQMACPEKWPVTGWTEEVTLPEGKIRWNVQTGTDTQNVIQNVIDHETDQINQELRFPCQFSFRRMFHFSVSSEADKVGHMQYQKLSFQSKNLLIYPGQLNSVSRYFQHKYWF